MSPEKEIKFWKKHFKILKNWKIYYQSGGKHQAQCLTLVETKKALICSFGKKKMPEDYIFHEMLHIAIKASRLNDDKINYKIRSKNEEQLVRDLSRILVRNKGILPPNTK
jgi:hypothetical protein